MSDFVKKELATWKHKYGRDVSVRCFGTQGRELWMDGPWWEAVSGKASSRRCKSLPAALEKLAELIASRKKARKP